ncbi:MAG: hypothetical protein V7750_07560 [Sneathiella sp.]
MTKDPLDDNMHPSLQWNVADTFFIGRVPTMPLNWVHDPAARILIKGEDQPWQNLLVRTGRGIEHRGYSYGRERAAIMTIMNLIPDLKGPLTKKTIDRLSSLFDVCTSYLDALNEEFILNSLFSFQIRKIIKGNLFRALLDDAMNSALQPDQWRDKARLFMEFAGPDDWKNRQCWNEGIFSTVNWPRVLTDVRYPSPGSSPIRPDLLTCLCLFEEYEYAECLIDMGYDLSHFLLFNFQSIFWRNGGTKPSSLEYVLPFCRRAVGWIEDKQKEAEPPISTSEWDHAFWHRVNSDQNKVRDNHLDREEYKALMVLKTLSNELSLGDLPREAVDGANAYLGAFEGLSLPEYTPELLD